MLTSNSYTRITLSLDILRKLTEGSLSGYHELGIIKHQIDLYDIISIEPSSEMIIECNDLAVPCDRRNLCWKAVDLIKNAFKIKENVSIRLEKQIPAMGGLAGGSANAATMLLMLNEMWGLNLDTNRLMEYGKMLGMDVPYYFYGATAFDSETTGIFEPIDNDLEFTFVLALPEFGVSTAQAYSSLNYQIVGKSTDATEKMKAGFRTNDQDLVAQCMHNDFEYSVFDAYPRLALLKKELLNAGCINAALSGSGSTIVGIAKDRHSARMIQQKVDCKTIVTSTLKPLS